ncbi:MAG: Uma2 family endonuclease [Gemmatimonadota bacterium]
MPRPQITWADAQQMPDDGNRYEAIEGDLYMTPAPTLRHQDVVFRLSLRLHSLLVQPGHGRMWLAPVGVEFPATGEGVQPDIVFVSRERRGIIAETTLMGPPDLAVEVLSPSTGTRDRGVKLRLYARQGIRQYWIVDPVGDAVEVRRFDEGAGFERFTDRLPVKFGDRDYGEIDLATVFERD